MRPPNLKTNPNQKLTFPGAPFTGNEVVLGSQPDSQLLDWSLMPENKRKGGEINRALHGSHSVALFANMEDWATHSGGLSGRFWEHSREHYWEHLWGFPCFVGCTPTRSCDNMLLRRVLRRVLERALQKTLGRVLRRGFRGRKGSERGSEYDPHRVHPILGSQAGEQRLKTHVCLETSALQTCPGGPRTTSFISRLLARVIFFSWGVSHKYRTICEDRTRLGEHEAGWQVITAARIHEVFTVRRVAGIEVILCSDLQSQRQTLARFDRSHSVRRASPSDKLPDPKSFCAQISTISDRPT